MNIGTYLSMPQLSSWKIGVCLLFISTLSMNSLFAQKTSKGPKVNPNALEARNLIIEGTEMMSKQEGVVDVNAFAKAVTSASTMGPPGGPPVLLIKIW